MSEADRGYSDYKITFGYAAQVRRVVTCTDLSKKVFEVAAGRSSARPCIGRALYSKRKMEVTKR